MNGTAGGTVSPGSGFYANGSTVVFTATPNPNYEFADWEGGVTSTANPLSVVVGGDMTLTARFQAHAFTDGFESGGLNALSWATGGDAPWFVQSSVVASGRFAARSGLIGDNQSSSLILVTDLLAGAGAFNFRVSSEAGWDFLEFYLNGARLGRWSGEVGWQSFQFRVPEAARQVIVYHAGGLHEGIANGGADEREAALDQTLAHGVGLGRASRHVFHATPAILQRFAIHVPAQRFAFDEFHRQEWAPVLLANIMHCANVGVIQRGSSQRFPAKPLQRLRIVH